jgi:hypothetical protein
MAKRRGLEDAQETIGERKRVREGDSTSHGSSHPRTRLGSGASVAPDSGIPLCCQPHVPPGLRSSSAAEVPARSEVATGHPTGRLVCAMRIAACLASGILLLSACSPPSSDKVDRGNNDPFRERITQLTASGDCAGLLAEFEAAVEETRTSCSTSMSTRTKLAVSPRANSTSLRTRSSAR